MNQERHALIPAGYVVLKKGNSVLLSRRFQTGYEDGNYSLPAGHVEPGEKFIDCGVRELFEEIGVKVSKEDLKLVHVMHRHSNTIKKEKRIDVFFMCEVWVGNPKNLEPEKCDDLLWADINNLPENTIPYIKTFFENVQNNIFFSEI